MDNTVYIGGVPLSYDVIEEFTNMNKFNNLLNKIAKDFTVIKCISIDTNEEQPFKSRQLYNFCTKALKTYIKFRLELMQNEKIQKIETTAIELAVKAGISYAESKFGVDIPDKSEDYIKQIIVEVAEAINRQRIDIFTYGLQWATYNLEKDSSSNETNS